MKNGRRPIGILALLAGMMGRETQPRIQQSSGSARYVRREGGGRDYGSVAKARRAAAKRRRIAARTSKRT